jgi:hypothetical protein
MSPVRSDPVLGPHLRYRRWVLARTLVFAAVTALGLDGCHRHGADARTDPGGEPTHEPVAEPARPAPLVVVLDTYPHVTQRRGERAPWSAFTELASTWDVITVDPADPLPPATTLVVVPMLTGLTQPQLDGLAAAIERGIDALVFVDPIPLADMAAAPPEPLEPAPLFSEPAPGQKGDAVGFLARFGVGWRPDQVLRARRGEEVGMAPPEVLFVETGKQDATATAKLGPAIVFFAGGLEARDGAELEPLLLTTGPVDATSYDQLVVEHPLFGPQMTSNSADTLASLPQQVVAARVRGKGGALVVVADLDCISDSTLGAKEELAKLDLPARPRNELLLPTLVHDLAGPPAVGLPHR